MVAGLLRLPRHPTGPPEPFMKDEGIGWGLLEKIHGFTYQEHPKTMETKGFHLQKTCFLGTKNNVFDGLGCPRYFFLLPFK